MIDTDKYEGHTPAPWKWIIDDKDTYLSCFDNDIKADENLIADAPLLLAEVKRLREGIKEVIDVLYEWDNGKYVGMIIGLSDLIE
jgi:hypothetical protein